jgi:hypothetical protein
MRELRERGDARHDFAAAFSKFSSRLLARRGIFVLRAGFGVKFSFSMRHLHAVRIAAVIIFIH